MAKKQEESYWTPAQISEAQSYGQKLRENPQSILPPLVGWQQKQNPEFRDKVVSALMGFGRSMEASNQAAQLGDPVLASLAAIGASAGGPTPDMIAAQRAQVQQQAQLAALEATPVEAAAPGLAQKYPELAGLPLGVINKIAPLIQRNESLSQQMEIALLKMREASGEKAAKREQDDRELQVPGYKLGKDIRPTTKEASDLRSGTAAMADFTKGVDRMLELINERGSTELTGEASGEMESLAANLKLTLKEVQKLGVLSATDTAFLEAQIFDPSKIKSVLTRKKTAVKQLETARDRAKSLTAESLKARGYTKSGGGDPLGIR